MECPYKAVRHQLGDIRHLLCNLMLGSSPVKSIFIHEDKDGKRALHLKQKEKNYRTVANFHLSVITFIKFPSHFRRYNSYLLEVQMDGVSM